MLGIDHGSDGERELQQRWGTRERAERFYGEQVLDRLNAAMIEFVRRMDMAFIATADSNGECDASFRAGKPGFLHIIDERTIAYPEYRGNGVMASMGNLLENPHVGIMLIDFTRDLIGLHINGPARIVEDGSLRSRVPGLPESERGRAASHWVVVAIEEAYIHCRKHIPHLIPAPRESRQWGTDNPRAKGGDYFGVKADAIAARSTPPRPEPAVLPTVIGALRTEPETAAQARGIRSFADEAGAFAAAARSHATAART
ncbi:pyridoxamine 5'-phosphate oxidase family protein [Nocardia sp. NEAU-G5]|uniref:Pyridoxamine 5'-phosphate oxidase family protein n=1 Tax=Nocardia albiluteola TaxID=2842303 RepID=A0ABS6ASL5_9NOCA|nr:pyridoxamine 5'-phosphate oxidase family protein [Nocardia albiluteola]MBU3060236.1 pyridoxamine 5'-phosphate oxidase family protein [Nocardia albiluteola]